MPGGKNREDRRMYRIQVPVINETLETEEALEEI